MKKALFTLLTVACAGMALHAQDITGDWYGVLEAGPSKLSLVFHISRDADGYTTVMDSPDQGASDIPMAATVLEGDELTVRDNALAMTYTAKFDGSTLQGTFRQGALSAPLTFIRNRPERLRPQTPQPPYPYLSEEVTFPNTEAGITLGGTLTIPEGEGRFPAAVLITGSGAQNRDEELFGHKPFFVLADYLARNGIAVLRYDDRGIGASGGDYASSDIGDFASDAVSAMEYLKTRPEVEASEIGFIGHSEGGMITYIIAAERGDAAFIVSMAGPAVDGDAFMREQRHVMTEAMGLPEEAFAENERLMERIMAIVEKYPLEYIRENVDSLAQPLLPEAMKGDRMILDQVKRGLVQAASPELNSLLRYRPAPYLARITCPVLAIVGGSDLQVPPYTVDEPLRKGVQPGTDVTVKIYPGLNHLFQHAGTGLPTEYGDIEETISPEVLADIAEWIIEVTRRH